MRNTNLDEVFFPVQLKEVSLNGSKKTLKGFSAVVGQLGKEEKVFSLVTGNYTLLSNRDAYNTVLDIFSKHFNSAGFKVFNILYPSTKSYVHIDVIHEAYTLNILEKEVYLPFFRITNSYNRTRKFTVDIGFVRRLCSNGVIFEKDLISISFTHSRSELNYSRINSELSNQRFDKYRLDFQERITALREFGIGREYFIPLAARALEMNFNTEGKDIRGVERINKLKIDFAERISLLSEKYAGELGLNAYAVYNVITDYISNVPPEEGLRYNMIDSMQVRAGKWLSSFGKEIQRKDFSIEQYVQNYTELFT